MKFYKIAVSIATLSGAFLFAPSAALAQGVAVFPQIPGSNCPTGFVSGGGTCDNTKSMAKGQWIGYVGNGNCASGYSRSGPYCSQRVKEEKSSSKSSSSSSSGPVPTPDQTYAYRTITARVKKSAEIDQCPTGYFTNRQDISECVTHYSDAPKSRLASGGKCSAGETLERGKYCTGATSMAAQDMDNAMTIDFNDLYTGYGIKHGNMPAISSSTPEVAAPAMAALNAEKNAARAKRDAANAEQQSKAQAEQNAETAHRNEQQRVACEAGKPNFPNGFPPGHPCEGFGARAAGTPTAPATTLKDALGQEAGKALRGLFGRQ